MKSFFKKLIVTKDFSILLVFIVLMIVAVTALPSFTNISNIQLLLRAIPTLGVMSLGVCLLLIAGEFDLSVGSVFALAPLICARLSNLGLNIWLALIIALGAGAVIGMINGLLTVKIKIPSFIVTLGTMMAWRGVVLVITDGAVEYFKPTNIFSEVFNGYINIIPGQFIWFIGLSIIFWLILNKHTFGNWITATGGNKKAAQAMGINTDMVKIICFTIGGASAAFAGMFDLVRLNSLYPIQGDGMALIAIAAVVIGGTSLYGGEGTIIGTFLGASIMFTIQDLLLLFRTKTYYFNLSVGVIIILAVIFNLVIGRRRKREF